MLFYGFDLSTSLKTNVETRDLKKKGLIITIFFFEDLQGGHYKL